MATDGDSFASMLNATLAGPPADINNQSFPLYGPDGEAYWFDTSLITTYSYLVASSAIIYSVQLGMAGLLFFVVLIMTRPDKRRSMMFAFNLTALLLAFFRNLLGGLQLNTQFYNFISVQFAYYPEGPALHHAKAVGVAAEIFNILLDFAIYASLIVQVYVICKSMMRSCQKTVIGVAAAVGVGACVTRLVLAVYNVKYRILGINDLTVDQDATVSRVASANNIVSISSIAFFTLVFNAKLLMAIMERRKMNMKGFGPMQIIFIMGCQTLIVPLIFAIMTYYVAVGLQLQSFVVTIVAVFLPLSGMWAASNTHRPTLAGRDPQHRAFPVGASGGSADRGNYTSQTMETLVNDVELGSPHSRNAMTQKNHAPDSTSSQANKGVLIARTYSIRSD